MRTLSKVATFQKEKDLFVLNINSADPKFCDMRLRLLNFYRRWQQVHVRETERKPRFFGIYEYPLCTSNGYHQAILCCPSYLSVRWT